MLGEIIAPVLGTFLISISLINFSSSINPKLHLFLNEQLKQMQTLLPGYYLKQISFDSIQLIFSIFLFLSGCILCCCQGIRRLIILVPLLIFSILIFQSAIISGTTLSNIPIYMFFIVCIIIILFHDCSQLDELAIK